MRKEMNFKETREEVYSVFGNAGQGMKELEDSFMILDNRKEDSSYILFFINREWPLRFCEYAEEGDAYKESEPLSPFGRREEDYSALRQECTLDKKFGFYNGAVLLGDFWKSRKGQACFRIAPEKAKYIYVKADTKYDIGTVEALAEKKGAVYTKVRRWKNRDYTTVHFVFPVDRGDREIIKVLQEKHAEENGVEEMQAAVLESRKNAAKYRPLIEGFLEKEKVAWDAYYKETGIDPYWEAWYHGAVKRTFDEYYAVESCGQVYAGGKKRSEKGGRHRLYTEEFFKLEKETFEDEMELIEELTKHFRETGEALDVRQKPHKRGRGCHSSWNYINDSGDYWQ